MSLPQRSLPVLLHCLQQFAEQHSNPVLALLPDGGMLQQGQAYPADNLDFGAGLWRGFYHCHPEEFRFPGEHGHFHLFYRLGQGESQWSHVAGLCMDPEGQPLRWFTVNHWITAGCWGTAAQLATALEGIDFSDTHSVLENYLLAMLGLYHQELKQLLSSRDESLKQLPGPPGQQRQDRSHYILSQRDIDLLARIKEQLERDGE